MNFYNEFDHNAAEWLRELIRRDLISPGVVDERSIADVSPDELTQYRQCHFFAGIGVWSYALRQAGWPDDRPIWTGSCPCQPFSAAGKRKSHDDDRHLWPHFFRLIRECRPPVVIGSCAAVTALFLLNKRVCTFHSVWSLRSVFRMIRNTLHITSSLGSRRGSPTVIPFTQATASHAHPRRGTAAHCSHS